MSQGQIFSVPGMGFQPLPAVDAGHRVAEVQGDTEIVEALLDVPGKAAGIRQYLKDRLDLGALQGEPSRHDHPDIA